MTEDINKTEKTELPKPEASALPPKKKAKPKAADAVPEVPGLVVSSSPHFLNTESVPGIMHNVILALLPACLVSIYFFRFDALILIVTCLFACLLTEYLCLKFRGKPIVIYDGSAAITGILLALTLPPSFPLYGAVIGSVFAIAIGKQIFGGLGLNIFNPALLGRAFLQATYPVLITTWTEPATIGTVDGVTAATPLALMKFEGIASDHLTLFFGNTAGSLGETSAVILLLGGLYLRYKGYINWKLPLGYLGAMALTGAFFYFLDSQKYPDPLFHLLTGGAMLGAWFMVTDMVTTPVTNLGQWIFAITAGIIAVIIRNLGGLPEGVMYSILLMNSFVPLLNRWTRPRVFGKGLTVETKGGTS
ncbi:MAG: RnfABCDGE type electron transport complex subunit D [Deltaproteobacteria bacterium]|nr:RnfABCDGE type electron transport complex subunit D [Deltaproteobacteria bacterium]